MRGAIKALAPRMQGRPVRFLIVGGVNTALGLSLYPLLLWAVPWLRVHYLVALGIAQIICLCFAFLLHKLAVFRTHGHWAREFTAFAGFYGFSYAVNWAALPVLVEGGGLSPVIAQTGFTIALVAGSWIWHKRVTFRRRG